MARVAEERVIRVLSLHADYACRRSGQCCTAGWPIAAEPRVERAVAGAMREGRLRLPMAAPFVRAEGTDAPAILALDVRGRCVFFEEGTPHACAIHRQLGQEMLPLACRQFPRVSLLTPRGVSLTLSHYCPTAASLLFRDDRGLEIVEDAPAFPPGGDYEGLDARGALPLLRPGVFLDWDAHRLWEEHAVRVLAREDLAPEAALARLERDAAAAAAWQPGEGALVDHIGRVAAAPQASTAAPVTPLAAALEGWSLVAGCVPAGVARPPLPAADVLAGGEAALAAAWPAHARTIRRYLAAKAFASWCGVQGDGLRTAVAFLRVALDTLRVEAAGAAAASQRPLDGAMLKEAIRASDLLLVHLADPEEMSRVLSRGRSRR
jgi:Fe-S-cluster containining protein